MDCPSASEGAFARVRFDCLIFVGPAKMKLQRANYRPNELIQFASVGRPPRFSDRYLLISGGRDLLVVDVGLDPRFRPRLRRHDGGLPDPRNTPFTRRCDKLRQALRHGVGSQEMNKLGYAS